MRGRIVIAAVLVVVVVLVAWNALIYGPAGDDLEEATEARDAAEQELATLDARLERLRDQAENQPERQALKEELSANIPELPQLETFIRSADDIRAQTGVDWISVAPAEPAPGPTGISEIRMTIQLEGGFFQVQEYLKRLEDLTRLVVVDAIQIGTGGETDDGSGIPSLSGAPTLTVSLTARMFTQATGLVTPATPVTTTTVAGATTSVGGTPTSAGGDN
jgi:Tfp pilus assembly protein PilO